MKTLLIVALCLVGMAAAWPKRGQQTAEIRDLLKELIRMGPGGGGPPQGSGSGSPPPPPPGSDDWSGSGSSPPPPPGSDDWSGSGSSPPPPPYSGAARRMGGLEWGPESGSGDPVVIELEGIIDAVTNLLCHYCDSHGCFDEAEDFCTGHFEFDMYEESTKRQLITALEKELMAELKN